MILSRQSQNHLLLTFWNFIFPMNPSVRCSVGRGAGSYTSKLISEHFFTPYSLINSDGCFFFIYQSIHIFPFSYSLSLSLPSSFTYHNSQDDKCSRHSNLQHTSCFVCSHGVQFDKKQSTAGQTRKGRSSQ